MQKLTNKKEKINFNETKKKIKLNKLRLGKLGSNFKACKAENDSKITSSQ